MSDKIRVLPTPAFQNDGFGALYDGLADEIDSLHCVEAIMKANSPLGTELGAAMGLLIRTAKRVDELHTALDAWHVLRVGPRVALTAAAYDLAPPD